MSFGKAIQAARKAKGMSQLELAMELDVSPMSVCNWEREKSRPNLVLSQVIKDVLGVDVWGGFVIQNIKTPSRTMVC